MDEKREILVGVTGSIAAFKAAQLVSDLVREGWGVTVIMTQCAREFITPLTFASLTRRAVVSEMFSDSEQRIPQHIALADLAELLVIAPATANVVAKLAAGIADDILTCTALTMGSPIVVAPAMNDRMYANPIFQENLEKLRKHGMTVVEPGTGRLACGAYGKGRMADLENIKLAIRKALEESASKRGRGKGTRKAR